RYGAHSIGLDANNNVYESGWQEDSTGKHIITMKYDYPVGIPSTDGGQPSFKVFPNPFATSVTVSLQNPNYSLYTCRVLNMFGQQVQLESFSQTVSMDLSALPAGIYYCEVNTENGR